MQSYIDQIVQALTGLLVVLTLGVIASLRVRINAWLATRTSAQQREILHRLAAEGMALAEAELHGIGSADKLDAALQYALGRLRALGLKLDALTVRAAIEKAVLDYNAAAKAHIAASDSNAAQHEPPPAWTTAVASSDART